MPGCTRPWRLGAQTPRHLLVPGMSPGPWRPCAARIRPLAQYPARTHPPRAWQRAPAWTQPAAPPGCPGSRARQPRTGTGLARRAAGMPAAPQPHAARLRSGAVWWGRATPISAHIQLTTRQPLPVGRQLNRRMWLHARTCHVSPAHARADAPTHLACSPSLLGVAPRLQRAAVTAAGARWRRC
jgi:hypothetical protein